MSDRLSQIAQILWSQDLGEFTRKCFQTINPSRNYSHNWHIDAISYHLEAARKKEIKRLIINMPPRSLKSICASVAFPAWILGHNPSAHIMAGSYALKLSLKNSRDTLRIMQDPWYSSVFPNTRIGDSKAANKFTTTRFGQRLAVSVGAGTIGEGGDYVIIDDPLSPLMAASDTERENANTWYRESLLSRLNDPTESVIILIMQRLHYQDMTGMLLEDDEWTHLCLPAINDDRKLISIGRGQTYEFKEGELLHPKRLPIIFLDKMKDKMTASVFAGQYLQKPAPEGGNIIKDHWWQMWPNPKPPKCEYMIQVYDTAYGEKQDNDYSVCTTWGIFANEKTDGDLNIILIDLMMGRFDFPTLREKAIESYKSRRPDLVLIEAKASGQSLIDEFKRAQLRVRAVLRPAHGGDKKQRAHAITPLFEQGRIWVPCNVTQDREGADIYTPLPFAADVIEHCKRFPSDEHDDIADTVIDAVQFLRQYKGIELDEDYEPPEPTEPRKIKYYG